MTKLTEEILRTQTCPFKLYSILPSNENTYIKVLHIGEAHIFGRHRLHGEVIRSICGILDNWKLPEPEPKLVTMYECIDRDGIFLFMDDKFRQRQGSRFYSTDEHAIRIPNGITMQLDISSDPWKWVTE